jgi:hypothetical protein
MVVAWPCWEPRMELKGVSTNRSVAEISSDVTLVQLSSKMMRKSSKKAIDTLMAQADSLSTR